MTGRWVARAALAACGYCLVCAPAGADDAPFESFNQNPLVQIYGLPALGPARVAPAGSTRVGLFYAVANNFADAVGSRESLLFDGETHRTMLRVARGIGKQMEIGFELPHVAHGGGFLDDFIENWHEFFGLPRGGRELAPANQLDYRYRRDGVDRVNVTQATSGIGDVRLLGALQLADSERGANDTALRVSIKLPTGDSARLQGSGAADVATWLSAACRPAACAGAWRWYGGGGVLWLGKGDVLPELQRRAVGFGAAGIHWRAWPQLTLTAQVDAHSPFYKDSDLKPLHTPSAQLVLGGTWFVRPTLGVEIAVSEDLVVDSAPDVVIQIGVRSQF